VHEYGRAFDGLHPAHRERQRAVAERVATSAVDYVVAGLVEWPATRTTPRSDERLGGRRAPTRDLASGLSPQRSETIRVMKRVVLPEMDSISTTEGATVNSRIWGDPGSRLAATIALLATATVLAGIGAAAATGAGTATIKTRASSLGRILVDGQGRTLYPFEKDKNGRSACYAQCAKFWPPVLTSGKPTASAGAKASLLGTTRRTNGTRQVTYAGHPLYRYLEDTSRARPRVRAQRRSEPSGTRCRPREEDRQRLAARSVTR
jgi:predicted lipoprotein with Yx(FWY)xxD motif